MIAATALAQATQPASAAKRLVGTWRLVSITESRRQESRGEKPTGLIYYDDKGNMAVQIMPDRPRAKFAGTSPTPDEARDAILGYTAYFGTYTVDEKLQTVTHNRAGNIDPSGLGDFVRRYEFLSEDKIVLRPLETKGGLTWERVK
ncbi:lipocalin-like domain-containing protein [Usitatibacter rugosus]|uniref:lipocalin-like domain-containing protein n=1 Tax=Usitatibacter rugosus TaxID=2732067 RepID=UPI0014876F1D|nr:lipocalin-like domain-containing protein [Usitatibacter rugosus]